MRQPATSVTSLPARQTACASGVVGALAAWWTVVDLQHRGWIGHRRRRRPFGVGGRRRHHHFESGNVHEQYTVDARLALRAINNRATTHGDTLLAGEQIGPVMRSKASSMKSMRA